MTTVTPWRPWLVCAVLLTATALSYLDRQALSVVAPLVREELELDNAQLGLLLSAFFYSYAAMHLFVGAILDRFNIRYVYGAFVACWSLAQAAAGLVRSFGGLFAARAALGVFEAAAQPGAARIIARLVSAEHGTLADARSRRTVVHLGAGSRHLCRDRVRMRVKRLALRHASLSALPLPGAASRTCSRLAGG